MFPDVSFQWIRRDLTVEANRWSRQTASSPGYVQSVFTQRRRQWTSIADTDGGGDGGGEVTSSIASEVSGKTGNCCHQHQAHTSLNRPIQRAPPVVCNEDNYDKGSLNYWQRIKLTSRPISFCPWLMNVGELSSRGINSHEPGISKTFQTMKSFIHKSSNGRDFMRLFFSHDILPSIDCIH